MVMVYASDGSPGRTSTRPGRSVPRSAAGWPGSRSRMYVVAQSVGAIVGGARAVRPDAGLRRVRRPSGDIGQNSFGDSGSGYAWWAAFLLELVMTAIFVYRDPRRHRRAQRAPGARAAGDRRHPRRDPLRRRSRPPAPRSTRPGRSAPALFAGSDAIVQLWLFILAPLVGGAIAGLALPAAVRPRQRAGPRLRARASPAGAGRGARLRRARPVPAGVEPAGREEQAAWEQEPIIQDGWQWDHAAQEWKPLEQWQPAPPAQAAPAEPPAATARRPAPAAGRPTRPAPAEPPRPGHRHHPDPTAGCGPARRALQLDERDRTLGRDLLDQADPARVEHPSRPRVERAVRSRPTRSVYRPAGVVTDWSVVATETSTSTAPAAYAARQPSPSRGVAGIASPASAPSSPARHSPSRPNHQTLPRRSWA